MSESPVRVIVVDDRPSEDASAFASELKRRGVDAESIHPADLESADFERGDIFLVDFELDADAWDQSRIPAANQCVNGWALASTIRWQVASADSRATPSLMLLLTNQIGRAIDPFHVGENASFGVASAMNGVEWVLSKTDASSFDRIECLARWLPRVRHRMSQQDLHGLLGVSGDERGWTDLLSAGVPATELLSWRDGVALFRWMLQRVFPYPTFLLSDLWIAARLGIRPELVESLIASQGPLGVGLRGASHSDFLAEFSGRRFWKRKLDTLVWKLTEGRSSSLDLIRQLVANELDLKTAEVAAGGGAPVVVLDEELRPLKELGDAIECCRIRPDFWPAYAADAWARRADVEVSEKLRSISFSD